MTTKLLPANRQMKSESTAQMLRDSILRGDIEPGKPLREESFSSRTGISRNTLREAFRLLIQEGLLVYYPNRGVEVKQLTSKDVQEIYQIRKLIEPLALQKKPTVTHLKTLQLHVDTLAKAAIKDNWLAAFDSDLAFHLGLVNLTGNERLAEQEDTILRELRLGQILFKEYATQGFPVSVSEHQRIVNALEQGRLSQARENLLKHLESSERLLLGLMQPVKGAKSR